MPDRETWNEKYAARELVWSAEPNELFAREVATLRPGKALDVACGEGRNGIWLAEHGWQVTAIDFSAVAIDKARKLAARRGVSVDWIVGDVSMDDLPAEAFDLVCVLYLHTSAEERARWLGNVIRAVRPSGTFLYIGHDPSNISGGVGGPQNPEVLPSVDELRAALTGFRLDVAKVVERQVAEEPGHGKEAVGIARDTLVRAVRINDQPPAGAPTDKAPRSRPR